MKKINWWNKIFHHKQLQKEKNLYEQYTIMDGFYKEIYNSIINAKDLKSLIEVHKWAWKLGYCNENLGPCPYGMFRVKDIENLNEDNLYLGNIWGLWMNSAKFWEDYKEELMGDNGFGINPDTKIYDIMVRQYKSLLRTNISSIKSQIDRYLYEYRLVNKPKNPLDIIC